MAQNPPRHCPQCGAPLPFNQAFCSNCGARQDAGLPPDPRMQPGMAPSSNPNMPQAGWPPSPPPYPQSVQPPAYSGYQQGYQQPYQQVPSYAQAQQVPNNNNTTAGIGALLGLLLLRRAERGAKHRLIGCAIWLLIILALGMCAVLFRFSHVASSVGSSPASTRQNDITPTVAIQKVTSPINAALVYSGIAMTIVDTQQASSFADDTSSQNAGVLRVDLKEQTSAISSVVFSYTSNFQLVSPDKTTISASAAQHDSAPDQSISRTNWVDFPIPRSIPVNQYTLRIGSATEAQMDIPLTGKADLSQYQPRKASLNMPFTYGGVNFTLTNATAELSANGPQASKGMMYVVTDLTINNTTTNTFYGSLTDVRLKSGATTNPSTTSLDNIQAGQTNVQGKLIFVMPQGSTNFSLIFLPSTDNNASAPVTTNFQIAS